MYCWGVFFFLNHHSLVLERNDNKNIKEVVEKKKLNDSLLTLNFVKFVECQRFFDRKSLVFFLVIYSDKFLINHDFFMVEPKLSMIRVRFFSTILSQL